eukprot:TRINITY_DN6637_c0_g1_i1.p1 TRINITY_DN6637_c0_g1~~TRINITY_DN6637_c0_g1_i1.p1  ORF type:complete len:184 (-),score=1.30 TRINITY_DN6637_c0_g1_i1:91-573(-)
MRALRDLVLRLFTFPIPTIAAINGHCFAGGFLMAMAHDYRFMRVDKGWMCMPAVDIGLILPKGLIAVVRSKVNPAVFTKVMISGTRFAGKEAHELGLAEGTSPETLLQKSIALGEKLSSKGRDRDGYRSFKLNMYPEAVQYMKEMDDITETAARKTKAAL